MEHTYEIGGIRRGLTMCNINYNSNTYQHNTHYIHTYYKLQLRAAQVLIHPNLAGCIQIILLQSGKIKSNQGSLLSVSLINTMQDYFIIIKGVSSVYLSFSAMPGESIISILLYQCHLSSN